MNLGRVKVSIAPINVDGDARWIALYNRLDRVKKTNTYYAKLAEIRALIKSNGWEDLNTSLMGKVIPEFQKELIDNKVVLNKLGIELQSRIALLMLGLS